MTASESLALSVGRTADSYVLGARGELDIATAPLLEDAFEVAVGSGADRIVLDLRATTFIDSTGLRVLLGMTRRAGAGRVGDRR